VARGGTGCGVPGQAAWAVSSVAGTSARSFARALLAGPKFVYSNLGFGLLGIVAAHASHGSLQALMAKRVFGPLGMTSTFWHAPEVPHGRLAPAVLPDGKTLKPDEENIGVAAGAGGIYSSVRDIARYVAFQLSAYPPRSEADHGLVHRATIREAHSTGVLQGGFVQPRGPAKKGEPAVEFAAASYGFGWAHEVSCNYDDIVEHTGAIESYRAAARFLTNHGVGFVVLTNFGNARVAWLNAPEPGEHAGGAAPRSFRTGVTWSHGSRCARC
jgi:CubicO group peptidase (beta-lactamase class C family)